MKNEELSSKKKAVSPKTGFFLLIIFILLMVIMFAFSALFSSEGFSDAMVQTVSQIEIEPPKASKEFTIIIDAGHGGEDPGAVANGVVEKDINLSIAKKLEELFSLGDYNVFLTRKEDVLLYNSGEENQKKQHDLKNRVIAAKSFENPVFISIHANKFYLSSSKGAQVFYGKNALSPSLADGIQASIKNLQKDNKRVSKDGTETVYILERLECPAVLVECGFLSNSEDAASLSSEEYTSSLAVLIYKGIIEWILENETNLCLR